MSKTRAQPDRARRPGRRVRRRRLPLPLPRRPALRSRRRLQLRGDGRALQRRPRQQLRQPRQPRAQHGGELLRRRRARRARRRSARRARPPPRSARSPRGMEELDYSSGFGAVWDLIRDTNSYIEDQQPWALHKAGDAAAVAAVLGDCLEALRDRRAARVAADPARRARALAPPRPRRHARGRSASPRPRRGAACTAGAPAGEGRTRSSPASRPSRDPPARGWVDSHCHLGYAGRRRRPRDRHRRRPRRRGRGAGLRGDRPRDAPGGRSRSPQRHPDVRATVGLHPHDASHLAERVGRARRAGPGPRRRGGRHRRGAASTSTTSTRAPRRAGGRVPRPGRSSRTSSTARS